MPFGAETLAFGPGAMNCRILGPPEFWLRIWLGAATFGYGYGFFLDSEYSAKEPRIDTFILWRPDGAGLDLDFRRWSVFPFFSV